MLILAIDTSAVAASCAILKDGKLISEAFLNIGLTHSQTLMTLVDTCLSNAGIKKEDIDILACADGPGSFTGIRIGVATVKGMAFGKNKPVYGISTLEAMAYAASIADRIICPVMDARCQQVYTAQFKYDSSGLVRLTDDEPLKLDELVDRLAGYKEKVLILGDGADITAAYLKEKGISFEVFPEIYKYEHSSSVAFAAWMKYNDGVEPISGEELQPRYLRLSQAERERKAKEN